MNDFIDQFNSYPLMQRILLLIIIMVGMYGLFHFFFYMPTQDKIENQKSLLVKLRSDREKFEQLKRRKSEVAARLEELTRQLYVARQKLPGSSEISALLQRIYNHGKTAGLEIDVFQHMDDQEKEYYVEIPVQMKLVGTFDELANFFYFVSGMTRIVNVQDLTLKPRSSGGQRGKAGAAGKGELEVDALATTFRYKGDLQAVGGAGKAGAGGASAPSRGTK